MQKKLYTEMFFQEKTYWWHVSKRRLVQRAINKVTSTPGSKLLDAGCGTGAMLEEVTSRFGSVYGADGSPESLKFCKKRGLTNIKLVDFEQKLPYQANYFDAIVCLDVLEHISNDNKLLQNFYRILRPGGRLYLTVPAYQFLWSYWDEVLGHQRRYRKSALKRLIKKNRLEVIQSSYFYSFLIPAVLVFRSLKSFLKNRNSDFIVIPSILNQLLLGLSFLERILMRAITLPIGLSIFLVAEKRSK